MRRLLVLVFATLSLAVYGCAAVGHKPYYISDYTLDDKTSFEFRTTQEDLTSNGFTLTLAGVEMGAPRIYGSVDTTFNTPRGTLFYRVMPPFPHWPLLDLNAMIYQKSWFPWGQPTSLHQLPSTVVAAMLIPSKTGKKAQTLLRQCTLEFLQGNVTDCAKDIILMPAFAQADDIPQGKPGESSTGEANTLYRVQVRWPLESDLIFDSLASFKTAMDFQNKSSCFAGSENLIGKRTCGAALYRGFNISTYKSETTRYSVRLILWNPISQEFEWTGELNFKVIDPGLLYNSYTYYKVRFRSVPVPTRRSVSMPLEAENARDTTPVVVHSAPQSYAKLDEWPAARSRDSFYRAHASRPPRHPELSEDPTYPTYPTYPRYPRYPTQQERHQSL